MGHSLPEAGTESTDCLRPPVLLDAGAAGTCSTNNDSAKQKCDSQTQTDDANTSKLVEYDYEEDYQEDVVEAADGLRLDEERPQEVTPPPIATFDEWTKEKLQEKQRKVLQQNTADAETKLNGQATASAPSDTPKQASAGSEKQAAPDPIAAKRNYASKECGAKVLYANAEAENKGAVLNDKERDDYMRNPCERAQNKFLIVELCETVQPTSLEIANFELFSSGPKDIRVSVSERYPTAEWAEVGVFEAQDTREIQSFEVQARGHYAKFLKLELLSHHGKEHYCTLSTVRVFGISMVDEYEAEASVIVTSSNGAGEEPSKVSIEASVTVEKTETTDGSEKVDAMIERAEPMQQHAAGNTMPKGVAVDMAAAVNALKNVVDTTFAQFMSRAGEVDILKNHPLSLRDCGMCPIRPRNYTRMTNMFCAVFAKKAAMPVSRPPSSPPKRSAKAEKKGRTPAQEKFMRKVTRRKCCRALPPGHDVPVTKEAPHAVQSPPPTVPPSVKEVLTAPVVPPQQPPVVVPETNLKIAATNGNDVPIPGTSTNHKESVFLKLNKRLSALELNMSLSSEYLSELSRRYVAHAEELQKQQERTIKAAEELAVHVADEAVRKFSHEIRNLRREVNELSKRMLTIPPVSQYVPPFLLNALSIPKPKPEERCTEPPQEQPLLYSEDALWTTDQVIYTAVGVQITTVVLILLVQFCARKLERNPTTPDAVRQLVQEEVSRIAQANVAKNQAGLSHGNPKDPRNRRRRKKKSPFVEATSSEPWDSAMETSSSLAAVPTPTPSETSEMENALPVSYSTADNMPTPVAPNQPSVSSAMRSDSPTSSRPASQPLRLSVPSTPERSRSEMTPITPKPDSPTWQVVAAPRRKVSNQSTGSTGNREGSTRHCGSSLSVPSGPRKYGSAQKVKVN